MNTFCRKLLVNCAALLYLPHALIYRFSSDVIKQLISCDVRVNDVELNKIPIREKYVSMFAVARVMYNNCYFRTLFFHRVKHIKVSKLLWGSSSRLEIPYDVSIGAGVKLDHPFSTILNAKAIGTNFRIKNNVTIGNKYDNENFRPIIGNNVYIGAGVIIIGNITIGNNVTIGAGSVVVKSIPDNCIAVGNPARTISK